MWGRVVDVLDGETGVTGFGPDRAVAFWFNRLAADHGWLTDVGHVLAVALHPWVFRLLVLAACLAAWRAGRRRVAAVAAGTMVAGSLLGVGLKLLIARPRPVWGDPVATEIGYSMPSGHALNAALGTGLLLWLAWPWLTARGWTGRAVAAGAVVVVAAALDRMVLGVHYLTDVTVGVALGLALTALAVRTTTRHREPAGRGV
jgi:membrane-associated phospholipid phosphatase